MGMFDPLGRVEGVTGTNRTSRLSGTTRRKVNLSERARALVFSFWLLFLARRELRGLTPL